MTPDPIGIVLILCTGNSCRSHLAEGLLRAAAGDILDMQCAGSKPAGYVHPLAVKAMAEIGIDISHRRSKSMHEFMNRNAETVITACGNADQACPDFPGQANRYHWPFLDHANATGIDDEILSMLRPVRDEICHDALKSKAGAKSQPRTGPKHPGLPPVGRTSRSARDAP